MKPTPLHLVISRLNRLPLAQQVEWLRMSVALEKPYSVRRNELQSLLEGKVLKQIRKENRAA